MRFSETLSTEQGRRHCLQQINAITPLNPQDWSKLGDEFESATAIQTLDYTFTKLLDHGDVIFLTAFGAEGCVIFKLLHDLKLSGQIPQNRIISDVQELESSSNYGRLAIANLDTGYQFKETLELKNQLEAKYDFKILMVQSNLTVNEQDAKYGKNLYASDPDQCCYLRKLVPLSNLLNKRLAWITSIRRDQTEHRASAKAFEYDYKFKLGKINPLIHWNKSDVWKFIHENKIPYNTLLDKGYDSIGCEPCTSAGIDRKGRWAGKDKIECGLHIQDSEMQQGGEFTI